jgi:hypothetical protein
MTSKIYIIKSSLIMIFGILMLTGLSVSADTTIYHMTAGDAVDLKWDSQNVSDCRAANSYYTNTWGTSNYTLSWAVWGAAPANFGQIKYTAGTLTKPGSHRFRFNCNNFDGSTRVYQDEYLYIYPLPVSAPTLTSSCTGINCTMSWSAVSDATSYVVRVTKPGGQSCPSGWTTNSSTQCERIVASASATFTGVSGTTYPWMVASRTGTFISSITSNGSLVGDYFTPAQASENLDPSTPTSVNVDFTN